MLCLMVNICVCHQIVELGKKIRTMYHSDTNLQEQGLMSTVTDNFVCFTFELWTFWYSVLYFSSAQDQESAMEDDYNPTYGNDIDDSPAPTGQIQELNMP